MTRRIRFHADFKTDLNAQLRWLAKNRDDQWILRLRAGLDEATKLLAGFPSVGTIERQEGTIALRRLILRDVPYVVWFLSDSDTPDADVWVLRLFHVRQQRPSAVISESRKPRRR